MNKEKLLDSFIRACKREVVVEEREDGFLISYPKPNECENKEEVQKRWKRLVSLLIKNDML